jgi:hypothetical protein
MPWAMGLANCANLAFLWATSIYSPCAARLNATTRMPPKKTSSADTKLYEAQSLFDSWNQSVQQLNEITKLLRNCGLERVVPPLPRIAVIGNQSAGKSSLIEAISKINVPRSKGTTTRCPMEVVLRAEGEDVWECSVSLRFEISSDVGPTGRGLGTFEFAKTYTCDEVSLIIRRAQLAILNPSKDAKEFLTLSEAQCEQYSSSELHFSRNVVVVEVTGADYDVAFIDLPGIISNTPNVFPFSLDALMRLG